MGLLLPYFMQFNENFVSFHFLHRKNISIKILSNIKAIWNPQYFLKLVFKLIFNSHTMVLSCFSRV